MASTLQFHYLLQLADNALILGHRLSEWCGHGPILEQDIALTNTALDHLGQARSLYQYAADAFNDLPAAEKEAALSSPLLQQVSGAIAEDDLASLRDGWDFKNVLLVEQPNGDWAHTVARSLFYDTFQYLLYEQLAGSPDERLAGIAAKSIKEVSYHQKWSAEWAIRLGDGTEESAARMKEAVARLWSFTGELFQPSEAETFAQEAGWGPDVATLYAPWKARIAEIFSEAALELPADGWMQKGGKTGVHSEQLGFILTELQFMQRAYPGMEW